MWIEALYKPTILCNFVLTCFSFLSEVTKLKKSLDNNNLERMLPNIRKKSFVYITRFYLSLKVKVDFQQTVQKLGEATA